MYENAGVSRQELETFWKCISSIEYIKKIPRERREKISAHVALAKHDKIVPFESGRKFAEAVKGVIPNTSIEEFTHTHFTMLGSSYVSPNGMVTFISKRLGG